MRKSVLLAASALLASVTLASAGGLDEPIIEAPVIEAATVSSGHGIIVPIAALVLIAAAVSAAD